MDIVISFALVFAAVFFVGKGGLSKQYFRNCPKVNKTFVQMWITGTLFPGYSLFYLKPSLGINIFNKGFCCFSALDNLGKGLLACVQIYCSVQNKSGQRCSYHLLLLEITSILCEAINSIQKEPIYSGLYEYPQNQALHEVTDFGSKENQNLVDSKEIFILCTLSLSLVRNLLFFDLKFFERIQVGQR